MDGVQVQVKARTLGFLVVVLKDWTWFTATKWVDYESDGAQRRNPTTHT